MFLLLFKTFLLFYFWLCWVFIAVHSGFKSESCSVLSNSLRSHGQYSPWNSPGQNTGVGSLSLLQGIFPTQGSNPGLPHCRQVLYQLSHKECEILIVEMEMGGCWSLATELELQACIVAVLSLVAPWHAGSFQTRKTPRHRDQTCVPCIGRQILNLWTTRKVQFCVSEHW